MIWAPDTIRVWVMDFSERECFVEGAKGALVFQNVFQNVVPGVVQTLTSLIFRPKSVMIPDEFLGDRGFESHPLRHALRRVRGSPEPR